MTVLACYSMKGGVGKSATAVNVAYMAARAGLSTLLIDLDAQGAASYCFRVKPGAKKWSKRFFETYKALLNLIKASDFEDLDVIPAHLVFRHFDEMLAAASKRKTRLARVLKGVTSQYDVIVLDCPPGISLVSEAIFHAADIVLVPVIPATLSERTFETLLDFFRHHDLPRERIIPFFSMVQVRKNLHRHTMDELRERYPAFLETTIPFSKDVENMAAFRAPIDTFAPRQPANQAFIDLVQELMPLLDKR